MDIEISKAEYSATANCIFTKFNTEAEGTKPKFNILLKMTASNGRRPQNVNKWNISACADCKLKMWAPNQN